LYLLRYPVALKSPLLPKDPTDPIWVQSYCHRTQNHELSTQLTKPVRTLLDSSIYSPNSVWTIKEVLEFIENGDDSRGSSDEEDENSGFDDEGGGEYGEPRAARKQRKESPWSKVRQLSNVNSMKWLRFQPVAVGSKDLAALDWLVSNCYVTKYSEEKTLNKRSETGFQDHIKTYSLVLYAYNLNPIPIEVRKA